MRSVLIMLGIASAAMLVYGLVLGPAADRREATSDSGVTPYEGVTYGGAGSVSTTTPSKAAPSIPLAHVITSILSAAPKDEPLTAAEFFAAHPEGHAALQKGVEGAARATIQCFAEKVAPTLSEPVTYRFPAVLSVRTQGGSQYATITELTSNEWPEHMSDEARECVLSSWQGAELEVPRPLDVDVHYPLAFSFGPPVESDEQEAALRWRNRHTLADDEWRPSSPPPGE